MLSDFLPEAKLHRLTRCTRWPNRPLMQPMIKRPCTIIGDKQNIRGDAAYCTFIQITIKQFETCALAMPTWQVYSGYATTMSLVSWWISIIEANICPSKPFRPWIVLFQGTRSIPVSPLTDAAPVKAVVFQETNDKPFAITTNTLNKYVLNGIVWLFLDGINRVLLYFDKRHTILEESFWFLAI